MTDFILYSNPTLTLICVPAGTPARYSLETAAALAAVHPEMLRHYCRLGLLGPDRTEVERDPAFDDDALYTVRRIECYRRDHGVNLQALPLLFALEREVERLEAEVRFLRGP